MGDALKPADPNPEALKPYIARALESALTQQQAEEAFDVIMSGLATPSQIGGFLMVLRLRGESIEEITGAATIMRRKALRVTAPAHAIDIVGTGGDGKGTLNISTAAALVVASLGVPIAKHGNKALSSRAGASDALASLGVNINADVTTIEACIEAAGLGYMNAPNHHAAMRFVGPARVELGVRTIFNILGPLTNPALVNRQLTGTFSKALVRPMAETLRALGSAAAWIVHGMDGTDEISIAGPTHVSALKDGEVQDFIVKPSDAGLAEHPFGQILGGTPPENADKMRALLGGEQGAPIAAFRDAVCLNAAAALMIAGACETLSEGVEMARASLDGGQAAAGLERLIAVSHGR
ncbi:MAG: anthranilate phosphoribosyltransferase [Pseudomonadota bacterium]